MVRRQVGENLARFVLRQETKDERLLLGRQRFDEIGDVGRVQFQQCVAQSLPVLRHDRRAEPFVDGDRRHLTHRAKDRTKL